VSSIPCSLTELRELFESHGAGAGTLPIGIDGVARPALVPGVVLFVGPRVLPGKKGPMSTLRRRNCNAFWSATVCLLVQEYSRVVLPS
jgi:hypothetical protein